MSTKIYRAIGFEDAAIVCLARVAGLDGAALAIADVATIQRTIWDRGTSKIDTPDTAESDESVHKGSAIFDSLQTDDAWGEVDTTGYNFRDVVPGTAFPGGGRRYQIKYVITLATGETVPVRFQYDTEGLMGG